MLIVDANVLVAAAIGRSRTLVRDVAERGVKLMATDTAIAETRRVALRFGRNPENVEAALEQLSAYISRLEPDVYTSLEPAARTRLRPRAQPDWPTLAAATAFGADIWSNDRDFFGTGIAVWSTRNVGHTSAA